MIDLIFFYVLFLVIVANIVIKIIEKKTGIKGTSEEITRNTEKIY